jgi:hypothetical protein
MKRRCTLGFLLLGMSLGRVTSDALPCCGVVSPLR